MDNSGYSDPYLELIVSKLVYNHITSNMDDS